MNVTVCTGIATKACAVEDWHILGSDAQTNASLVALQSTSRW